jgi:hypothetical protein
MQDTGRRQKQTKANKTMQKKKPKTPNYKHIMQKDDQYGSHQKPGLNQDVIVSSSCLLFKTSTIFLLC